MHVIDLAMFFAYGSVQARVGREISGDRGELKF